MSETASDPAEAMQSRLRADLRAAMKARQSLEVALLRGLIAAIDNAQSAGIAAGPAVSSAPAAHSQYVAAGGTFGSGEVERRTLGEADIAELLDTEAAKREATAAEMDRIVRLDLANDARAEIALIRRYL